MARSIRRAAIGPLSDGPATAATETASFEQRQAGASDMTIPDDDRRYDGFDAGDKRLNGADAVIPVVAETLVVDKRTVDSGRGVRVHKRIHEDVVVVDETVHSDALDIERVPVGRTVESHPTVRHEGDTMIVPVVEERVVTRVELVLVEEIRITRRRETRPFREEVVLRREDVVVERFSDAASVAPDTDGDLIGR